MKRLLLIAYAVYVLNLFLVGSAHTRVFLALTLVLAAIFVSVVLWGQAHPDASASRALFSPRGPRTDVPFMTRSELLRSSLTFLAWGALLFSVYVGLVLKLSSHLFDSVVLACLSGTFMLAGLMALSAGGYLLLRGLLRSSTYRPPAPSPSPSSGAV